MIRRRHARWTRKSSILSTAMATRWRSGCVKARPVAAVRQRTRRDQSRGPAVGGASEGSGGHRRRGRKRLAADLGRRQASARHRPRAVPARLLQRRHAERPLRPHSDDSLRPAVSGSERVEIRVANHYWLTGSFIHGTGEGHADAPDIDVQRAERRLDRGDKGVGRRGHGCLTRDRIPAHVAVRQHIRALHQRPAAQGRGCRQFRERRCRRSLSHLYAAHPVRSTSARAGT